jgi:hypothetical protein
MRRRIMGERDISARPESSAVFFYEGSSTGKRASGKLWLVVEGCEGLLGRGAVGRARAGRT